MSSADPIRGDSEAFRRSLSAPPTAICLVPQPSCAKSMHAVIICRPSLPNFGAIAANNAFWHLHRDKGHTRTLQPPSSPPRLLCRSPGPVPSGSGLRCPKPHLSRVFKLTPARNTLHTALARTNGISSQYLMATAFVLRSSSAPSTVICLVPQPSCTERMHAVIICRPSLPNFGAIAANNAFRHLHRDKVTRGRSSLPAHHLAFSVALLAQAHQYQV